MKNSLFISLLFLMLSFSVAKQRDKDKNYGIVLESFENPICRTDSFHVKALGNHPCKNIVYEWYRNGKLEKTSESNTFSIGNPQKGDVIYVVSTCKRHKKDRRYTSSTIVVDFKECNFYQDYQIITKITDASEYTICVQSAQLKKAFNVKLYDAKGTVVYTGKHTTNEVILLGTEKLHGNHFLEIEIDNVITHKLISF